MPRFVLRQLVDGYYWVCPTCGYSQEQAVVLRPTSSRFPDSMGETHMRAGFRADGLMSSALGVCLNCEARQTHVSSPPRGTTGGTCVCPECRDRHV